MFSLLTQIIHGWLARGGFRSILVRNYYFGLFLEP